VIFFLHSHYCQGQEEDSESGVRKAILLVLTYEWEAIQEVRLLGPTQNGEAHWSWQATPRGFRGGLDSVDLGFKEEIVLSRDEMLRFWEVVFSGEYLKIAEEEDLTIPQADMEMIWGFQLHGFLYRCGNYLGKEVITMFLEYNDLSQIDGITEGALRSHLNIWELGDVPAREWAQWFSENKEKLLWDSKERRFVLPTKKTEVKMIAPPPVREKSSLALLILPFLPFIIAVLLILTSVIISLLLRKGKKTKSQ